MSGRPEREETQGQAGRWLAAPASAQESSPPDARLPVGLASHESGQKAEGAGRHEGGWEARSMAEG